MPFASRRFSTLRLPPEGSAVAASTSSQRSTPPLDPTRFSSPRPVDRPRRAQPTNRPRAQIEGQQPLRRRDRTTRCADPWLGSRARGRRSTSIDRLEHAIERLELPAAVKQPQSISTLDRFDSPRKLIRAESAQPAPFPKPIRADVDAQPGLWSDHLRRMKRVVERNARGREAPMVITPSAVARLIKQTISAIRRKSFAGRRHD